MSTQNTTTVNFGAFPGTTDTSVAVTGQAAITTANLVEAWIYPVATADHLADEHWVDPPDIVAGTIVNGVGFTIYAKTNNNKRHYGQYTVAWVWN